MLTKEEMPACPVVTTVQLIGSKWKLLIMRNLLQRPCVSMNCGKIWRASARKCSPTAFALWKRTASLPERFIPKFRPAWSMP